MWNIVIADDCSTDGTRDILEEFKNKYEEKFTLILQESNVGPHENWLALINHPDSKYIAYIEGDDYWIDDLKLQRQVDFLEQNSDCSFCFHRATKYLEKDNRFTDTYPKGNFDKYLDASQFFRIPSIPSASVVFRNNYTTEFFDHSHGDFQLYCQLLSKGKAGFIDQDMSVYRLHTDGVSSTYNSNLYLSKRIEELLIEKEKSSYTIDVKQNINRILCEHMERYVHKNRGNKEAIRKKQFWNYLFLSKYFFKLPLRRKLALIKSYN